MKKLHVLLIKSFIGPLVLTFFIALFVLIMQFLFRHIDDLVGKGLEFTVIGELLWYASASLVPMALPLAVLLASLMTFGNLGEYYELTALKASGISLLRIMQPLIVLVGILTIAAFLFANFTLPKANLKTGALLYDIKHLRPELNIKVGVFNNDLEGYTIRAAERNETTGMFYDFMIYDHTTRKGNKLVTTADSAKMIVTEDEKSLIVDLYSGRGYEEMKNEPDNYYPMRRNVFGQERIIFDLSGFQLERTDEGLFKHNYQMLNLSELQESVDSLNKQMERKKERFYTSLMDNNVLRKERKINPKDTIKQAGKKEFDVVPHPDSLLAGLELREKRRVISIAHNYAKSTESFINSSSNNLKNKQRNIAKHEVQWHRKFTLSLACLIFFLIGAPLGAIIRRGGLGLPTVVSVLFFILYYVLSISGEKFAREGFIAPDIGMWLSTIVLLPLAIFLSYKAITDSSLLNLNYYRDRIKNLVKGREK